jgi:hypothetical protein
MRVGVRAPHVRGGRRRKRRENAGELGQGVMVTVSERCEQRPRRRVAEGVEDVLYAGQDEII